MRQTEIQKEHHFRYYRKNGTAWRITWGVLQDTAKRLFQASWNDFRILIVLQGNGTLTYDTPLALPPGTLVFRSPEIKHKIERNSDWAEFYITLPSHFYKLLSELELLVPNKYYFLPPEHLKTNLSLGTQKSYDSEIYNSVKSFSKILSTLPAEREHSYSDVALIIHKLFIELKKVWYTHVSKNQFEIIADKIRGLSAEKINWITFSKECGMGYETLRKGFVREIGISPHEYLINCRIDRAKELLWEGKSIAECTALLRYSSENGFIKQFRMRSGETPAIYRKRVCE